MDTIASASTTTGGVSSWPGMSGRGGLSPSPPIPRPPSTTTTASAQAKEHGQGPPRTSSVFSPGPGLGSTAGRTATATMAVSACSTRTSTTQSMISPLMGRTRANTTPTVIPIRRVRVRVPTLKGQEWLSAHVFRLEREYGQSLVSRLRACSGLTL